MLTLVICTLISVMWLGAGTVMIVTPSWWTGHIMRAFADPFSRFLILQGTALAGLLLLLSASEPPRSWLWIAIGAAMTTKALILLGLRETSRNRLLTWWMHRPTWFHQVSGFAAVALAVWLAVDTFHGW